jgi:hypothetical protein
MAHYRRGVRSPVKTLSPLDWASRRRSRTSKLFGFLSHVLKATKGSSESGWDSYLFGILCLAVVLSLQNEKDYGNGVRLLFCFLYAFVFVFP